MDYGHGSEGRIHSNKQHPCRNAQWFLLSHPLSLSLQWGQTEMDWPCYGMDACCLISIKPITREGRVCPFVNTLPNKIKESKVDAFVVDVHSNVKCAMCKAQTHRNENGWKDGKEEKGGGRAQECILVRKRC